MKKFTFVLALALVGAALLPTVALAAPTNTFFPRSINQGSAIGRESVGWEKTGTGNIGYLTWSSNDATINAGTKNNEQLLHVSQQGSQIASATLVPQQAMGPHGNYAINTIKCATCHSVHMAPEKSWLLTPETTADGVASTAQVCAMCHNALTGLTDARVSVGPSGVVSNHETETCSSGALGSACHGGVHGVGVSKYPTLAKSILNGGADVFVDYALANDVTTGLTAEYFDTAENSIDVIDKNSFAVSYLCTMCHQGSAFATVDGMSMYAADPGNQKTLSAYDPESRFLSSHPMLTENGVATDAWTADGASFTGKVAYADSVGCVSCHSKVDPNTNMPMFPHSTNSFDGYANKDLGAKSADGLTTNMDDPKGIWLEQASFAGAGDTKPLFRADAITYPPLAGSRWGGAADGVCLSCHRAGADGIATAGVGITY